MARHSPVSIKFIVQCRVTHLLPSSNHAIIKALNEIANFIVDLNGYVCWEGRGEEGGGQLNVFIQISGAIQMLIIIKISGKDC